MANSGSTTQCGGGVGQDRIDCILRACQYNMTDDCFNTMMDSPQDYATFHPLLARTCALGQAGGLNLPLSDNCRRFCRMDPVACRASRQRYCATFADPGDPRSRELCACYLPPYLYTRITTEAVADLAIESADQLTTLQDLITNNLLTPSCWYGDCVSSKYGSDTEIVTPCQSLGICIQSISTQGTSFKGRVNLENSCSITVQRGEGELFLPPLPTDFSSSTTTDTAIVEDVVTSSVPTASFSLGWLWIVILILVVLLALFVIYLLTRPTSKAPDSNDPRNHTKYGLY